MSSDPYTMDANHRLRLIREAIDEIRGVDVLNSNAYAVDDLCRYVEELDVYLRSCGTLPYDWNGAMRNTTILEEGR